MKKRIIAYIVIFALAAFLSLYKLDYYVMKPGNAYEVGQFLEVENGDEDDEGTFSLMTVSMYQATPVTYVYALMKTYYEILPVSSVRQEGEDDDEYNVRQLHLMTSSQFNALYTAFTKAEREYTISYNGVYVLNVLDGGAATGIIKAGDEIIAVDETHIEQQQTLVDYLQQKKLNDVVQLTFIRDEKQYEKQVTLKEIPGTDGRVGLGISFDESKSIETSPKVKVDADEIGGPSAGLMFTLELLNQLEDEDLTKGYMIAGTGEMLVDGTVGRIGGVEKKVVAADEAGIEVFFAPDDEITDEMKKNNPTIESNYEAAVKTAKEIHSQMKIVPVKTIDDALAYLQALPQK